SGSAHGVNLASMRNPATTAALRSSLITRNTLEPVEVRRPSARLHAAELCGQSIRCCDEAAGSLGDLAVGQYAADTQRRDHGLPCVVVVSRRGDHADVMALPRA